MHIGFRSLTIGLVSTLIFASDLAGQTFLPDEPVRVTVRDSIGERRIVGVLGRVTSQSLVLRVEDADTVVTINRRDVVRVEQRRQTGSVGKAALLGCLFVGGLLAAAGSGVHDPDSPGIGNILAIFGFGVGCAIGGGVSGLLYFWSSNAWQEITV
jgi:hypothetical protein